MTVKLIKVIENSLYEAGKFSIDLNQQAQQASIVGKSGKLYGSATFRVSC